MAKDYKVGYGKPPKETRFQKGQSGNPKGRPKGSGTGAAARDEVLRQAVVVTSNGRKRKITAEKALWQQVLSEALQGDKKARQLLLDSSLKFPAQSTPANDNITGASADDLAAEDEAILEAFRRRGLPKEDAS